MKLLKVKYNNLFSLGQNVELKLNDRGLVLVTGESKDEGGTNGSGKSSLTSKGIIWTLYGTTTGGLKADSVVNRHGKKKASGQVEFIGFDGEKYRVVRERPSKLSLFKGGHDVSAKSANETQKLINSAVGMNFATFIQTVFFGQGRSMSYASLTSSNQKALLSEILPMREIDQWIKYTETQAKVVEENRQQAAAKHATAETKVSMANESLLEARSKSTQFEAARKRSLASLIALREEQQQKLKSDYTELERLNFLLKEEDSDLIAAEQFALTEAANALEKEWHAHGLKVREADKSKWKWEAEVDGLNSKIEELSRNKECPTCQRVYDDETVKVIDEILASTKMNLAAAQESVNQAQEALRAYTDLQNDVGNRLESAKEVLSNLDQRLISINSISSQIELINSRIENTLTALDVRIDTKKNELNPHDEYVKQYTVQYKAMEEEATKRKVVLNKLEAECAHLAFWRGVYSKDLKLRLFEECCEFLDERTEEHLKALRNPQFHVEFSTVKRLANGEPKDEFSVKVWSETGGDSFDALSGGEQQMVSFAIGLALADLAAHKTASEPDFLILDEPFSELDARNSEAIVEYLGGIVKSTVLLISNEETLKGLIPERVHVVKEHGVTNVNAEVA